MNDHQFCFILCVSDEVYQEECLTYLRTLEVPEGYTTDILTIGGAESMCAGYNAAMHASDAKYKIYLHQDVFIRERRFLYELLDLFADPTIGMIGMVGTERLSDDAVMWNGQRVGAFLGAEEMVKKDQLSDFEVLREGVREVQAVDGLLMATQVDVPWREDLFDGWDFYDVSQSFEIRKAGYRVVVKGQPWVWYRHDAVTVGLGDYEKYRQIFLDHYSDQFLKKPLKKRILYPLTASIRNWEIPYALKLIGAETLLCDIRCSAASNDQSDADQLARAIREQHADAVMTHDYYPFAAMACDECGIPYLSWVWDSLQEALYDDSLTMEQNYIFDFDKLQAADSVARGAGHVYHMPLAANTHRVEQMVISAEDERKYRCDISFIGSLYSDPYYELNEDGISPETQKEVDGILEDIVGHWDGRDHFTDRLSDAAVKDIAAVLEEKGCWRTYLGDRRYIEQTKLSRRAAYLERMEMLRRLSGRDMCLYTWETEKERGIDIPGIKIFGELDYLTEMPKAYYLSKINLNVTLPSIRSGVPLRIFDIMAAGGFALTNYQPEIEDLFVIGRDLEVYHSFEELTDKVDYYLLHERERLRIAVNGNKIVSRRYTYEKRVREILHIVSEEQKKTGKAGIL